MGTVVLELHPVDGKITQDQMDALQAFGDACAEAHDQEEREVKTAFPDLSDGAVLDIVYLRTRSRWSPELEARLIQEHRSGTKINIMEWPPSEDRRTNHDPGISAARSGE